MTEVKFKEVVDGFKTLINQLIEQKGKEYASQSDRLSNFKRAALFQGCTPEKALLGMVTKQLVSIYDLVDRIEIGGFDSRLNSNFREKTGDVVVYMILLQALMEEG